MTNTIALKVEKNGVANLVFDLPDKKINKLSALVLEELKKALNVIDGNKAIRVLIITSNKPDIFIAGADINEIREINNLDEARAKVEEGQKILTKIAQLKIPTISVIKGSCLGGGLELALACRYRIAIMDKKTLLGLPEVNLGIIPGFGGTQRLPRLIGLQEALAIILSGKSVDAQKACKIGLVDDIFREEFLEEKLGSFVSEILQNGERNQYLQKRIQMQKKRFIFESLLFGKFLIFYLAKKNLYQKTKGCYPAPFYALEVIKRTYKASYNIDNGLKTELEAFCELITGEVAKNLIEIFFTNEALKKDSGITVPDKASQDEAGDRNKTGADIKDAALLGAGVMGGGIAWLFAANDINIRIKDITQNTIALGYKQILENFNQLKKIKKATSEQINIKITNVTNTLDFTGFDNTDFVLEAVTENMALKKRILAEFESHIKKDVVIVSNTSSLSISQISHALQHPERFAGMHFFNPVNRMPLVEVIYGDKTSAKTIAVIVELAKKLGKTPVVVRDVAGFLVNRILLPYMNEACYLLQEGAEILETDAAIEKFGMPMGPFILADTVGIDVGVKVAHSLFEAYGERMKVAQILDEIYKNHKDLLGKKAGQGFYIHANSRPNPQINYILSEVRKSQNIKPVYISDSEIIDRCILMMVNEAAKCLEENVVKNARYLDMAMIMGAGFPAFRGGLLRYCDSLGIAVAVKKLQELHDKHGARFAVSKLLLEMAKNNQKFY